MGPTSTLFLDEISTGLDSSTTYLIVKCMRNFVHMCQVPTLSRSSSGCPYPFSPQAATGFKTMCCNSVSSLHYCHEMGNKVAQLWLWKDQLTHPISRRTWASKIIHEALAPHRGRC